MRVSLTTDADTLFIKSTQLSSILKTQVNHFCHFRFRFRFLRRPLPEANPKLKNPNKSRDLAGQITGLKVPVGQASRRQTED